MRDSVIRQFQRVKDETIMLKIATLKLITPNAGECDGYSFEISPKNDWVIISRGKHNSR